MAMNKKPLTVSVICLLFVFVLEAQDNDANEIKSDPLNGAYQSTYNPEQSEKILIRNARIFYSFEKKYLFGIGGILCYYALSEPKCDVKT